MPRLSYSSHPRPVHQATASGHCWIRAARQRASRIGLGARKKGEVMQLSVDLMPHPRGDMNARQHSPL
ncbi:hypothetical protein RU639_002699 [Aspergillus parasiticus]